METVLDLSFQLILNSHSANCLCVCVGGGAERGGYLSKSLVLQQWGNV